MSKQKFNLTWNRLVLCKVIDNEYLSPYAKTKDCTTFTLLKIQWYCVEW